MIRAVFAPLVFMLMGLSMLVAIALPGPAYAEPESQVEAAPITPAPEIVKPDPEAYVPDEVLRHFMPHARFVGRLKSGTGYVIVSSKVAFRIRTGEGGKFRLERATDPGPLLQAAKSAMQRL